MSGCLLRLILDILELALGRRLQGFLDLFCLIEGVHLIFPYVALIGRLRVTAGTDAR